MNFFFSPFFQHHKHFSLHFYWIKAILWREIVNNLKCLGDFSNFTETIYRAYASIIYSMYMEGAEKLKIKCKFVYSPMLRGVNKAREVCCTQWRAPGCCHMCMFCYFYGNTILLRAEAVDLINSENMVNPEIHCVI